MWYLAICYWKLWFCIRSPREERKQRRKIWALSSGVFHPFNFNNKRPREGKWEKAATEAWRKPGNYGFWKPTITTTTTPSLTYLSPQNCFKMELLTAKMAIKPHSLNLATNRPLLIARLVSVESGTRTWSKYTPEIIGDERMKRWMHKILPNRMSVKQSQKLGKGTVIWDVGSRETVFKWVIPWRHRNGYDEDREEKWWCEEAGHGRRSRVLELNRRQGPEQHSMRW